MFLRNACIHITDHECHSAEDSQQIATAICSAVPREEIVKLMMALTVIGDW